MSQPIQVTEEQKELLISFLEENPRLISNKFKGEEYTAKISAKMWGDFGREVLNIIPGPKKSGEDWKKTWQSMRRVAKDKQGRINIHSRGTGGGKPCKEQLTPLQERIVNLIGTTAIEGHTHPESIIVDAMVNIVEHIDELPDSGRTSVVIATEDEEDDVYDESQSSAIHFLSVVDEDVPSTSAGKKVSKQGGRPLKKIRIRAGEARLQQTKVASEQFRMLHVDKLAQRRAEFEYKKEKDEDEKRIQVEKFELYKRKVGALERIASALEEQNKQHPRL